MAIEILTKIQSYFYDVAVGIVILLVGFGLGVLVKKLSLKGLKEIELNRIMGKVGVTYNLEKVVSSLVSYVIYLFTIVLFLDHFAIRSYVLWLIVGAILMLIILTFLVGMKDIIPNFIGWLFIQRKSKIKEGHRVEIREIAGKVEKIGFLETEIRTDRNDVLYVPNSLFLKSKFRVKN